MKITFFTLLSLITSIFLSSCGTSSSQAKYNVYFFTANQNVTNVPTLFDVEPGVLIQAPEEPQRPGFEFGGWFVDFERTISWDFETDLMPNQSFVLYANASLNA